MARTQTVRLSVLIDSERRLAAELDALNEKRRALVEQLRLVRLKLAGQRRRGNTIARRGVGDLLEKEDPELFARLAKRVLAAKDRANEGAPARPSAAAPTLAKGRSPAPNRKGKGRPG